MVKGFLGKTLCLVLIISCFTGLNAFGEQISFESAVNLIATLENKLESYTPQERTQIFNLGKIYFQTNGGIDDLIELIKSIDGESSESSLINIIKEFSSKKNELIIILSFIKSIDVAERNSALTRFSSKTEYGGLNQTEEDALADIYSSLVKGAVLTEHQITGKVLLDLICCIKGSFVLTDSEDNKNLIAVKSINSDFANRLSNNVKEHFPSINGRTSDTGKDILEGLISALNSGLSHNMISNYKTVFGALGMYVKYVSPTSPSTGSSGANTRVTYPNPQFLQAIPTPLINNKTSEILAKFSDMTVSHWASPYIAVIVEKHVFNGYEDGEFKPEQGITREEVAVSLVRALGLQARLGNTTQTSFADNSEIGEWAEASVALLVEMGLLNGYQDDTFRPQNVITREEFAVIVSRAVTKPAASTELTFSDKASISVWAEEGIKKTYAAGIVKGYDDNTFRPKNNVTRAEVATMLYNFMAVENLL